MPTTLRGAVSEVLTGSEDFRPGSMLSAEEQLVRVRVPAVVAAYVQSFARQWSQAS